MWHFDYNRLEFQQHGQLSKIKIFWYPSERAFVVFEGIQHLSIISAAYENDMVDPVVKITLENGNTLKIEPSYWTSKIGIKKAILSELNYGIPFNIIGKEKNIFFYDGRQTVEWVDFVNGE